MSDDLTLIPIRRLSPIAQSADVVVPSVIAAAGGHAARRFLEFFAATIHNRNTRTACYRAACSFFAWVERHRIGEPAKIEPLHVAAYIEAMQATAAKPSRAHAAQRVEVVQLIGQRLRDRRPRAKLNLAHKIAGRLIRPGQQSAKFAAPRQTGCSDMSGPAISSAVHPPSN
jgi:hypothetical protein